MRAAPYLAIAGAIVAVSFATPLIKLTASPTPIVAFYRMALAALILLPFAVRAPDFRSLSRRDFAILAGTGIVLAVHFATWIASLKELVVPTTSSLVLVTSHPILVALVSHFVFRERVKRLAAIGISLGLTGVAVIALGSGTAAGTLLGNSLAFLGGVMAGVYILVGRQMRQRLSLATYAFVVYGVAAVALLIGSLAGGLSPVPSGVFAEEFAILLGLAVISQIGGHTLYNWSLRHVSATVVSVSLLGEPIGASLLTWSIFGEVPPVLVAAGAALALPGILLTAYSLESHRRLRRQNDGAGGDGAKSGP
jgi:drug/metabolite transporter (DMT)-like permease